MLVLSRNKDQAVDVFLGEEKLLEVRVIYSDTSEVKIAFEALEEVTILRRELAAEQYPTSMSQFNARLMQNSYAKKFKKINTVITKG